MATIPQKRAPFIRQAGGWRKWIVSFFVVGLAVAATFLIVTSLFPGETFLVRLEAAYSVLWENTTRRQFTYIMRENPWTLIVSGVTIIFVTGQLLHRNYWSQAVYVYLAFGIGSVFGHVFWYK
jgi:hypothetical protein